MFGFQVDFLLGRGGLGGDVREWRGGRRRRRCAGPLPWSKDPVVVCDEKLDQRRLVAALLHHDCGHVVGHKGAQQRGSEHNAQIAWAHLVLHVL